MSDITLDLLSAIESTLAVETASGGDLEDLGSYFVLRTSSETPTEYGAANPMLIVSALTETGKTLSIPPIMTEKVLPIRFSLFTENGGDTTDDQALELIKIIDGLFWQQTYGLSEWWDFVSLDPSQTTFPAFSGDWNGRAEWICQHTYTDMRACVEQKTVINYSVSPETEVEAGSLLSAEYDILRIFGDVVLIGTPTIQPGRDGQHLTITGMSDTEMPTLQDNSHWPGSDLRLINARDMTLGKNDSILLYYSSSQAVWIEQRRSDTY